MQLLMAVESANGLSVHTRVPPTQTCKMDDSPSDTTLLRSFIDITPKIEATAGLAMFLDRQ